MCSIVWLEVDARLAEVVTGPEELSEAVRASTPGETAVGDHLLFLTKGRHGYRKFLAR